MLSRLTLDNLASSRPENGSFATSKEAASSEMRTVKKREDRTPIAVIFLSLAAVFGYLGLATVMTLRKRRTVAQDAELPPEPVVKVSELPEALFAKRQDLLHLFENLISDGAGEPATVELVMSSRLSIAHPQTLVEDLRRRMKAERLRHFLICDTQGKLLGMVSDRDLAKSGETAERIMSKSPLTVGPQTPLITAVTILINRRFSSLPVVVDGNLVGILTTTDILLAMQATVMLLQRK